MSPLVVVPAGVAELSAGVVLRGVGGATAPCCEEAAADAGRVARVDEDALGELEVAGPEAEAEGEGADDEAEGEEGEEADGEGEGEAEEEGSPGDEDGEACGL